MQYYKYNAVFCYLFSSRCTNRNEVTLCFLISQIMLWRLGFWQNLTLTNCIKTVIYLKTKWRPFIKPQEDFLNCLFGMQLTICHTKMSYYSMRTVLIGKWCKMMIFPMACNIYWKVKETLGQFFDGSYLCLLLYW